MIVVPIVIIRRNKFRRPESEQNLAQYYTGQYPDMGPGYRADDPRVMDEYVAFGGNPAVRTARGPDPEGRAVIYDERYDDPDARAYGVRPYSNGYGYAATGRL